MVLNERKLNSYQTSLEVIEREIELGLFSDEVRERYYNYLNGVPLISYMIDANRPYARDIVRDASGKIEVDITRPHILEDMDYFRPAALHYLKHGCYTKLRPNSNPNSEFGKWLHEEVRRCYEGYVRESDGEWITGDYYYFLNYAPMLLIDNTGSGKKKVKHISFPQVWEGHYLKSHAIEQAIRGGHHFAELASRRKGKSYFAASMLAKRILFGEGFDNNRNNTYYITATDSKKLTSGDQTLDKFVYDLDWMAQTMEVPSMRLIDSLSQLRWKMGYKDLDTGVNKGTLNSVIGITSKDDSSKLRGTHSPLYVIEEFGTFSNLLELYNNLRPSVEEGDAVVGTIMMYGTTGDKESDFYSAKKLVYEADGYNIQCFDNVYSIQGKSKSRFAFFFPGYINYAGCYDNNGMSDVTLSLLHIIQKQVEVKHSTTDILTLIKSIAEIPITPEDALLRTNKNDFPSLLLNQRLVEIDNDIQFYDKFYVGTLQIDSFGEVHFVPTAEKPIRDFPINGDNVNTDGAIEIYEMPKKNNQNKVFEGRYVIGHDPVDADIATSSVSLSSTIVFDLYTDKIVAEYTGRKKFADQNFEIVRLLCLFYNARCLFENNIKGCFSYFSSMRSLHLLADTPEFLYDKQYIKERGYGNVAKGVRVNAPLIKLQDTYIRDWLNSPAVDTFAINKKQEDEENNIEHVTQNALLINNRALLKELIAYNHYINVDRIRALGLVMFMREEFNVKYNRDGKFMEEESIIDVDPYFKRKKHFVYM